MRVLIVGPCCEQGGLSPYLETLATNLRTHTQAPIDRCGSTTSPGSEQPWPLDTVMAAAQALRDDIDFDRYDLISLHFGHSDVEQLLPLLWGDRHPPVVYHVHTSTAPLLLQHGAPHWHHTLQEALSRMDGYVYHGESGYGQDRRQHPAAAPVVCSWLPTTLPPATTPLASPALAEALHRPDRRPLLSLYGSASPNKGADVLLEAVQRMHVSARILLAGPHWDNPHHAGLDLTHLSHTPTALGAAEMTLVPEYLPAPARSALIQASTAGIFPYHRRPTRPGAYTLADYLAAAKPVIASDSKEMRELIGPAGYYIDSDDPETLAIALDALASRVPPILSRHAAGRAQHFTAETHAQHCWGLYTRVYNTARNRTPAGQARTAAEIPPPRQE